ncbi:uncharacterized protein LOC120911183 [Rana temporaria]|uniref:uncharacterized protein LOC120911183 n=1 Tax=Rana temporaria TaxID=8407 RepID=UPI001AAC8781|nr:uncharacterized protein LOC120911183 [Rana temporaria]
MSEFTPTIPPEPLRNTLKNKSDKFPPLQMNSNLAAFVALTTAEIKKLHKSRNAGRMTYQPNEALEKLKDCHQLTIKPSDKGGNIVIQTNDQYRSMCLKILSNKDWYIPIPKSTIIRYETEFYALVDGAFSQGVINQDTWEFIRIKYPKIPTFYCLPKVHKDIVNPPGRPIVSGNGALTENLSMWVDSHLKPFVLHLPSYIKDTIHLLQKVQHFKVSPGALLVAIDVEALYSSIPHSLGLSAIKNTLLPIFRGDRRLGEFLIMALEFILYHGVFSFDGSHFLQVQGVAMGTSCAPSYANLYLGEWEKLFLTSTPVQPLIHLVSGWHRYIDVLMIWEGSIPELERFMTIMNCNDFNLKFTMNFSSSRIAFLDVTLLKSPDGTLSTGLFRKPIAGNTILHATSAHPSPLIKSIPYSQYLRLKRNCSTQEDFLLEAAGLRDRLLLRGYSKKNLKRSFQRANGHLRSLLLTQTGKKSSDNNEAVRIITKYHSQHQLTRDILKQFWHLLLIDPQLGPFVPKEPAITYRRAQSLRDHLVTSEFKGTFRCDPCKRKGTFTCGGCSICRYINSGRQIVLPNGQLHKPRHYANCKTVGVVYLLTCHCKRFYVGKTKLPFHKRASRHLHAMRTANPDLPLGRHILTEHDGHFLGVKFLILDRVHPNPRGGDWNKILLQLETRWIAELEANHPPGLNEQISFRPFLEGFSSGGCEKD